MCIRDSLEPFVGVEARLEVLELVAVERAALAQRVAPLPVLEHHEGEGLSLIHI